MLVTVTVKVPLTDRRLSDAVTLRLVEETTVGCIFSTAPVLSVKVAKVGAKFVARSTTLKVRGLLFASLAVGRV